jgi:hypothetical protein
MGRFRDNPLLCAGQRSGRNFLLEWVLINSFNSPDPVSPENLDLFDEARYGIMVDRLCSRSRAERHPAAWFEALIGLATRD